MQHCMVQHPDRQCAEFSQTGKTCAVSSSSLCPKPASLDPVLKGHGWTGHKNEGDNSRSGGDDDDEHDENNNFDNSS